MQHCHVWQPSCIDEGSAASSINVSFYPFQCNHSRTVNIILCLSLQLNARFSLFCAYKWRLDSLRRSVHGLCLKTSTEFVLFQAVNFESQQIWRQPFNSLASIELLFTVSQTWLSSTASIGLCSDEKWTKAITLSTFECRTSNRHQWVTL